VAALGIGQPEHHIDLLSTDVDLPGKNFRQVADAVTASRSEIKVLFMTGILATPLFITDASIEASHWSKSRCLGKLWC
jgi:DNA-binding NarL/FixJ family response regulator